MKGGSGGVKSDRGGKKEALPSAMLFHTTTMEGNPALL